MERKFLYNNEDKTTASCFMIRNKDNKLENITLVGKTFIEVSHTDYIETNDIILNHPNLSVVDRNFLEQKGFVLGTEDETKESGLEDEGDDENLLDEETIKKENLSKIPSKKTGKK